MQFLVLATYVALSFIPKIYSSPAPAPAPAPAPVPLADKRSACAQDNLLNNLEASAHLSDSYSYCSALISVPATSTVTIYTSTCILSTYTEVLTIVHPLYLYNLQPIRGAPKPLSYNQASPTPSTVPGGAQSYGYPIYKRDVLETTLSHTFPSPSRNPTLRKELVRRDNAILPSWLATTYPVSRLSSACSCLSVPAVTTTIISQGLFSIQTTSTCTSYVPTTVATYPAMCAPSLQVNAVEPATHSFYKITPKFSTPSKMDCCAACAAVFNCVWWKFDFGTMGDGWQPGTCHYAYYTGPGGELGYGEAPAICPNGETQGITNTTGAQIGREANNNDPGYNLGPCGNAYNNFESNEDSGLPDDYYQHSCSINSPTTNPPGCA